MPYFRKLYNDRVLINTLKESKTPSSHAPLSHVPPELLEYDHAFSLQTPLNSYHNLKDKFYKVSTQVFSYQQSNNALVPLNSSANSNMQLCRGEKFQLLYTYTDYQDLVIFYQRGVQIRY